MIVVDASVLVNALTSDDELYDAARAELGRDVRWCAPQHFPVEVFSGVRGRLLGGEITAARGRDAVAALASTRIDLVEVAPLLGRMWELRANVSGYDAAYVALAETWSCPLVTADARLARASGPRCEIRLAVPES